MKLGDFNRQTTVQLSMDEKAFVSLAERDAFVIDAIRNAIVAMSLTTGCSISADGMRGQPNFDRQLAKLQAALFVLGAEVETPASQAILVGAGLVRSPAHLSQLPDIASSFNFF